ncbi:MAG: Cna B-type domain-containing protein [Tissierellia bacterium]|nr:Cna B-type domain-containing protein [Tissierellia bacterium]
MKSDNPDYPMPAGSVDGVYSMIITGANTVKLPEIKYSSLGVYTYTIYQEPGSNKLASYDDTRYNLVVYVTNAEDGSGLETTVILYKLGETEKYDGVVFENEYEKETIDVTATKVWVSGPPVKPVIQLQLYRDGEAYGEVVELDGVTSYTWQDLDKTDAEGKEYVYTVQETVVPNDYEVSYSEDGLTVTNTWVKAELPKTGMGSSTSLLVTGMGLLMVTVYLGFKRRRDD